MSQNRDNALNLIRFSADPKADARQPQNIVADENTIENSRESN